MPKRALTIATRIARQWQCGWRWVSTANGEWRLTTFGKQFDMRTKEKTTPKRTMYIFVFADTSTRRSALGIADGGECRRLDEHNMHGISWAFVFRQILSSSVNSRGRFSAPVRRCSLDEHKSYFDRILVAALQCLASKWRSYSHTSCSCDDVEFI